MTSRKRLLAAVAALMSVAAIAFISEPAAATSPTTTVHHACSDTTAGKARCFAEYTTKPNKSIAVSAAHAVSPADIKKAYNLPTHKGQGAVVAIVDAYDNPTAESDLATYRARYGLPACTAANGCFRKVNQRGSETSLPIGNEGWGLEIALDLDAVSAACPNCSILLVEADNNENDNLGISVNTAVRLGAKVVSNSYGSNEDATSLAAAKKYYTHPGVPILASTGDDGFESIASFPADSPTAIAVGGTTLKPSNSKRGWSESAWSGGGSGCSAYVPKPAWQKDSHCLSRTISDISADADTDSGLLVEDTYGFSGIVQVGGTSLSSPLVAGMMAMADTTTTNNASIFYRPASKPFFTDVSSGTNGYCGGDYLCTSGKGYDAPTGVGTPFGIAGL